MKPDWSTAPKFAKCLAMDSDGLWTWFEAEPNAPQDDGLWLPNGNNPRNEQVYIENWRETKEKRPS
jgi:hypothetical protein